jgi:nucleoside-diphosphate-sugar epimerase
MRILVTGGSGFIGTNYIELLLKDGKTEFINLDSKPPRNTAHREFWRECDILDALRLEKIIKGFKPTHVVHLAAKTGLDEKLLSDFAANIDGVESLVRILKGVPSLERAIFTSSLLVCKMGYVPKDDNEYKPTTLYGQSKVRGEQIVRSAKDLPYAWTIIRPISVWGPYAEEPYRNFFQSVSRNWYFHIGPGHYKRSMGYVENMAYQIQQLLLAPVEKVDRKVFYLGDSPPIDLYEFANEIQSVLGARKISHLPLWIVKLAAINGDIIKAMGWKKFPLTSFRLNNIRTEYMFNLQPIMDIAGPLPYDSKHGIRRTVQYMRQAGEI